MAQMDKEWQLTQIVFHCQTVLQLWCSTCPLVFGCWELSHVIIFQAEKERTAWKAEKIHKMTTIFTDNDNLGPF